MLHGIVSAAFPISLFACSFWPVRAVERYAGTFNNTALANKILVLGNTVCHRSHS